MAWIRRLPSGLWAATVYTPAGRITWSTELKGRVERWARDLEVDVRRGDFIDPRAGLVLVGRWWEKCRDSRRLELASRKRDESHWRCHVAPRWAKIPVGAILKPDVSGWVVAMERHGLGAATIGGALGVLRALLEAAVDAKMIRDNPARGVKPPRRKAHLDRVLAPHEDELLLTSLERQFPGRPDARLFVELLLYCGLRWEEAAAIDREHVDLRRKLVQVGPVVERDGTIRAYPKSPAGVRPVPVDEHVWPRLRDRALATPPGSCLSVPPTGLLFTTKRGKVLNYSTWHDRVWQRGLDEVVGRDRRGHIVSRCQVLEDPQPTPHDLRHTYGTRLGEQRMPPHEIAALMGHENLESVQRYLHAGEDRFDRARKATSAAREPAASRS